MGDTEHVVTKSDKVSVVVPRLETGRLILRAQKPDDLEGMCAMWAAPDVTKYITEEPQRRSKQWARIMSSLGHWALLGYGNWAVEEKASGTFIGTAGLSDYERDLEPSIAGVPEAGWMLRQEFHGKGYATEAMRAALHWHDTVRGTKRTVCIIDADNAPSLRLAEKLGYRPAGDALYGDQPVLLFERPAA